MSTQLTVADLIAHLQAFAPLQLAESWDNVGLLVGDRTSPVRRVMTCLTLTPDVALEAVERQADLIVAHHPLLFRPVQKLTADTSEGATLLKLIRSGAAVYSPHTAFDSCLDGINQRLAEGLKLQDIRPLRPTLDAEGTDTAMAGGARCGRLPAPVSLLEFLRQARTLLQTASMQYVGDPATEIQTVAVACGSAAEFLGDARRAGCDLLLTGEARFHACLEARDSGVALVLAGHYATERPAVERLAELIGKEFPALECWASRVESDPVRWLNESAGEND